MLIFGRGDSGLKLAGKKGDTTTWQVLLGSLLLLWGLFRYNGDCLISIVIDVSIQSFLYSYCVYYCCCLCVIVNAVIIFSFHHCLLLLSLLLLVFLFLLFMY